MPKPILLAALLLAVSTSCKIDSKGATPIPKSQKSITIANSVTEIQELEVPLTPKGIRLAKAAESIIDPKIDYDPAYFSIDYPNGDVPAEKGVCSDVVIRSFRKVGIDLQKEVHEDMAKSFSSYPKLWGLSSTDKNIDHRRVPNLMKYFERKGYKLPLSQKAEDYSPGDVVAWELDNGLVHIGVVSQGLNSDKKRFKIVHNIGGGQVQEDILFSWTIIGHYRWK